MSSPMSIKRRRVNDINGNVRKPFVSPMRTSKTERPPLKEDTTKANVGYPTYTPSTLAHTIKPAVSEPILSSTKPAPSRPTFTPAKSTPLRKPQSFSAKKTITPEEQALRKQISQTEYQIRKVQNELDTLQQAHKLIHSTTDDELRELSEKWRLCSQSVAEELFGTVKERVQRMGGVAAWRDMEKRKYERANGLGEFAPQEEEQGDDDADCEFDSEGEELPEEEQEWRKKVKRQALQEARDAADVPDEPEVDISAQKTRVWQEDGKDDDTFTMDMMLRSLNIDLDLIGYDKDAQRWT
ncbi:hypothetical protein PRZ48_004468 [Zasmidium cellare]|uniref:Swi5-dependent recombination DNA repair protein 1 n=1 Tax=Zasmidium cellare TaxID=395010 RepID=A0ABR0EQS9_ZASCE|nr:hypothetical protein PRZ48_004468 [Zasmidium cellare]